MKSPEEILRDYRLALISLAIVVIGGVLLYVGLLNLQSPDYQQRGLLFTPGTYPHWPEILRDSGIAALSVGGIGLVFEFLNRKAMERATARLFEMNVDKFATGVAETAVARLVEDKRFVLNSLSDNRRKELLRGVILAQLDGTASDLATRVAAQISGQRSIHGYAICYFAGDNEKGSNSRLEQSLFTAHQPNPLFEFHFQVIDPVDKSKHPELPGPDVFFWRHWLAPTQRVDEVLQAFRVISVKVNGVALTGLRSKRRTHDSVAFEADYEPIAADEYKIDTTLELPPCYEGGYVFLDPGVLCRGITVQCNTAKSDLKAATVETLAAANVTIRETQDKDGKVILTEVSTDSWILPNAAVAFVFYTPTRPYNVPSVSPALALVSPIEPDKPRTIDVPAADDQGTG